MPDTPQNERVRTETYEDLNITVSYNECNFTVYDIMYILDDKSWYEGIDGCGADDKSTPDITKANKYISGIIKWDGCSHLYFGDRDGYIHACGSSDVLRIGKILEKVYRRVCEINEFTYDVLTPQDNK